MPGEATIGFEAPLSRFLVTNKVTEAVTFLDRIAIDATATHTLNAPFELTITVPSDHPEVNLHAAVLDPAQPFIEEGVNHIFWFLRWGVTLSDSDGPWECMGAGVILNIEDQGDDGNPLSTITAYDPWKLLYHIPVMSSTGDPTLDPLIFQSGTRASEIAVALVQRAETFITPTWNSRIYINTANIQATDPLTDHLEFPAGTSVAEAWDTLVEMGGIDIYLKPIFDPVTRPGKLAELHIYKHKGTFKPEAIFSWDRWPRSAMSMTRTQDGTARANALYYWAGVGGPPAVFKEDVPSRTKYGTFYEQQAWPSNGSALHVEQIAARELTRRKNGQFDYALTPAGERAPLPFKEYDLGDTVPVWASRRLRRAIEDQHLRVQSIPMTLVADQLMQVQDLTVAIDIPEPPP